MDEHTITIKDFNDVLRQWQDEGMACEVQREKVGGMLRRAPTVVEVVCAQAGEKEGAERDEAVKVALGLVARMNEMDLANYRTKLAKYLGKTVRELDLSLRTLRGTSKKGGEDALEEVEMVGGLWNGYLVELVYDPEECRTGFVVRSPDGQVEEKEYVVHEGMKARPVYPNALIMKNAVLLPSSLRPLRSTAELVGIIRMFIHQYLDVDEFYEKLASYYVLFTWLYDCFQLVPYLRALGDYGTGKTRLLQVVGSICYRPMFTGGASTTSPIFRMLDKYRGTLVLDEADFGRSDEAQDIIKILNTGYMKGVPVLRSVDRGMDGFDVEAYEVYGPKILGTRKRFQDRATESRCLTKEMGGGIPRFDIPIVLPRVFWDQAREIRNLLLAYRMRYWEPEMEVDYNAIDRSIEPRLNQVTMALKTIVSDERMRGEIDDFIREYNRQLIVERSMTLASKVLEALVAIRRGQPFAVEEDGREFYDLSLKAVARKVNEIIEGENKESGEDAEEEKRDDRKMVGPKRCGEIARSVLQLKTERATSGRIKGNYFVVWDDERVGGLCARYGVGDLTPGPSPIGEGGEEREKWRQAGLGEGVKE